MLGDHGDDMVLLIFVETRHTFDGDIVRFRGTRGEHDLFFTGVDKRSHLLAGNFHRRFGFPAIGMAAAVRIAEFFGKIRQHFFQHARIQRCRGLIIEIEWKLHSFSFLSNPDG